MKIQAFKAKKRIGTELVSFSVKQKENRTPKTFATKRKQDEKNKPTEKNQ